MSELAASRKRLGTTTVFVTHDQSEAMAMSDRIAVMFEGRIRQVGTPDEFHRNPCDIEVAKFMSQPFLNTLNARRVVKRRALVCGEGLPIDDAAMPGEAGTLGFRPEHCRLSPRGAAGSLPARVTRVEHGGAEAHVFLELANEEDSCPEPPDM